MVLLHELLIEVAEVCGRDGKLVVADILLHGRAVLALAGVPVVDGLDHVLAQRQTVKHTGLVDIREVEVRENAQIAVLQLGGIVQQLLHGGILGHCLLPLEIVRHLGVHTAVGKAGQLEVDVGDALLGKILIHGDDVCRRSHGTLDRDRDRGDLLGGLPVAGLGARGRRALGVVVPQEGDPGDCLNRAVGDGPPLGAQAGGRGVGVVVADRGDLLRRARDRLGQRVDAHPLRVRAGHGQVTVVHVDVGARELVEDPGEGDDVEVAVQVRGEHGGLASALGH